MVESGKPLQLKHLTKRYGKFRGVDDVSLELNRGEVFGFLGPNGAGKSTTIRTILNFIKPSDGSISVFGLDSVKDDVQIKNHIGYLAGDIALYENMTGLQVLEYLTSLGKKTNWNYVEKLSVKLQANLNRPIKTLSKGNKQKIGIIQAFMHRPELLILDEPTSGLDPLMKKVFYKMVDEMRADKKTFFVSSHDLTEVQRICDRAAFVREGKIISIHDIKNSGEINLRMYEISFKDKPKISDYSNVAGLKKIEIFKNTLHVTVAGSVEDLLNEVAKHGAVDLLERESNLEDLFMHFYKKGEKGE